MREVVDGPVEFAHADPAMSPVPIHAGVPGMLVDPLAEHVDGLAIEPRVADAAAQPDDGVGIVRIGVIVGAGHIDVFRLLRRDVGRSRVGIQGLAEEGEGLGAFGERAVRYARCGLVRGAVSGGRGVSGAGSEGERREEDSGGGKVSMVLHRAFPGDDDEVVSN